MSSRQNFIKLSPPAILHEVVACPGHLASAIGFGLAFATEKLSWSSRQRSMLWVREIAAAVEAGDPYGPGLAGKSIPIDNLVVARLPTYTDTLRAALEGARCQALGAVILETIRPVELTASRRLKLAAEKSGVVIVLIQLAGVSVSNSAQLRWMPRSVDATDFLDTDQSSVFDVTVLKHPAGQVGQRILVRWNHERRCFIETLPMPMVSFPGGGSLAA